MNAKHQHASNPHQPKVDICTKYDTMGTLESLSFLVKKKLPFPVSVIHLKQLRNEDLFVNIHPFFLHFKKAHKNAENNIKMQISLFVLHCWK